jgi:hypothetical protein
MRWRDFATSASADVLDREPSVVSWSRKFDESIRLSDGQNLITLLEIRYCALFDPDRKRAHWGRRKLRRDQ